MGNFYGFLLTSMGMRVINPYEYDRISKEEEAC